MLYKTSWTDVFSTGEGTGAIPFDEYYGMGKVMNVNSEKQTTSQAEEAHWEYTIWFRKEN